MTIRNVCVNTVYEKLAGVTAQGVMINAGGVTTQQANNLLSLKRAVKNELMKHFDGYPSNTMTVYEPFTGLHVKIVRAKIKSRWYVYGSGKKQTLAASLFGDNSSIIYVSE